jgi:phage FluMu protein Com
MAAKLSQELLAAAGLEVAKSRTVYQHEKCAGWLVESEVLSRVPADVDCPICKEVRDFYTKTGQVRATRDTPLATELGLRTFQGTPGFSVPQG